MNYFSEIVFECLKLDAEQLYSVPGTVYTIAGPKNSKVF